MKSVIVNKFRYWVFLLILVAPSISQAISSDDNREEGSAQVLQAFGQGSSDESDIVSVDDKTKRIVMFSMGVPLLTLLLITAGLGIAMGVYGKQVYVPHMVCAGLSICLAIAHAVAGIVWFYPF